MDALEHSAASRRSAELPATASTFLLGRRLCLRPQEFAAHVPWYKIDRLFVVFFILDVTHLDSDSDRRCATGGSSAATEVSGTGRLRAQDNML
jgi:hypothetical protein